MLRFTNKKSSFRSALLAVGAFGFFVAYYFVFAVSAEPFGIAGCTDSPADAQSPNGPGCSCHASLESSLTTVTIIPPADVTTFVQGSKYTFTVTVKNTSVKNWGVGIDIAAFRGALGTSGSGESVQSSQVVQTNPKSLSSGTATWSFTYTPRYGIAVDTLYATGNVTPGSGIGDWSYAPKFIVQTATTDVQSEPTLASHASLNISPNPSSQLAKVYFTSPTASDASLEISDIAGGEVKSLPAQHFSSGQNALSIDVASLRSGQYFLRVVSTENQTLAQQKMIVAR